MNALLSPEVKEALSKTLSHMPPAQAVGGEVTSWADLYSLMAMLYEMVPGRRSL